MSANVSEVFDASVKFETGNDLSESQKSASLQDQLTSQYKAKQDQLKWDIQGTKVGPKSLNIARLSRFQNVVNPNVRSHTKSKVQRPFSREFSLYTHHWRFVFDNFASHSHVFRTLMVIM